MYCRKCLKEFKEEEKKVNMHVDSEEQCYICPECGHVVYWGKEEE